MCCASGPSRSRFASSRTRPSRRGSNSRSCPPSSNVIVNRFQAGFFGFRAAARRPSLASQSPPSVSSPSASVTRMWPLMPRWMASSGPGVCERPSPEVSHQIDLPCRFAAVSVRPTSACADLSRRVRPADVGVGVVDVADPAVQRRPLEGRPGALDLGKLGHPVSLSTPTGPCLSRVAPSLSGPRP